MPKICSVICGSPERWLPEKLEGMIICADRGLDYAIAAGITPDLAIGDFDSAKTKPCGMRVITAKPEKDETDTILACREAAAAGCTEIRLYCALGGRIDHTIANIQTLYGLKKQGISAEIISEKSRLYLLSDEEKIIPQFDGYLSVFAFGESCVVSEIGMKYPVEKAELTNSFPLGVSNEITAPQGRIILHSGTAIVVECKE